MSLIRPRSWALVLVSACLQIAAFPVAGPLPYWRSALGWMALAPLIYSVLSLADAAQAPQHGKITHRHPRLGSIFLLGYSCGAITFMGSCYWIYQTMYLYGGLAKPISFVILLLFALYLGLYQGVFALVLFFLRRNARSAAVPLLLSPALWVAIELARARITGFPWDLLGNSQVDNLLLTRLAPFAGVMSLSFVLAGASAIFAGAFLHRTRSSQIAAVATAMLAVSVIYLGGRAQAPLPSDRRAVAVQENLAVGAMGREVSGLTPMQELTVFSALSKQPDQAALINMPVQPVDLVVWPEAPSHFQSSDPVFRREAGALAASMGVPAIIGSLGVDLNPSSQRGYFLYDSASLFRPDGTYSGRYDKIHLVPWGEYIPFKGFFAFAQKLTEGAGDMDPGQTRNVFHAAGHSYGVFICYESIFGEEVREFAGNGAEVLVNISDDGWYGDTGAPWQHLNMARMRAIENNRWVIRSTNTGVTTSIDPLGRLSAPAPRHVRGGFTLPFGFVTGTTFYTRYGDWFADLCAIVSLLACGSSFAVQHRRKTAPAL